MSEHTQLSFDTALSAAGFRFAIVVSRFNSFVTDPLLAGALEALSQCGADPSHVDVVRVPGAWELPIAARAIAAHKRHDAIVCLGAVIRGGTPHFDYVAGEAARGIADASADTGIPMAFGVLTTDTVEQAVERAGGKCGNKGFDAAMTAIEMANLLCQWRVAPDGKESR
jgi:6,7-dimethyl-8-ribityllumazine synthase